MQIPDYFKFFNRTRIVSGRKALENIPYELQSMDAVKPLIVTDRKSADEGFVKTLVKAYGDSGLVIGSAFDGVTGYASTKSVIEAAELFRVRGCDSLIAIGGENCAAVARGVNLLVSHKTDDLLQFTSLPDAMHLRPFIVIPTSDSTGGETSSQCVIDARVYQSSELMPDIAVIDPRMLKSSDKSVAVHRGLRAMADAIEACAAESANPLNDSFAFASIQLIRENLPAAVKGGFSSRARLGLANGIAISGIVSSNAPEGICSALAGELSKNTGHSRELCTALLIPHVLDYKLNETKNRVRPEILLPLTGIDRYCSTAEAGRSRSGVDAVKDLVLSMGKYLPAGLKELNIPVYVLESTAAAVDARFAAQYGKDGAIKILKAAYEGRISAGGVK